MLGTLYFYYYATKVPAMIVNPSKSTGPALAYSMAIDGK